MSALSHMGHVMKLLPKDNIERSMLAQALQYRWSLHAHGYQRPPQDVDWTFWLTLGGRGSGKTRGGAEQVREWAEAGTYKRGHLIAPTAADARDTMVEGPAGVMAVCPPWYRPTYEPSKRKLTWPDRADGSPGMVCYIFSADEPERLRGPQCDFLWADEIVAWRFPETWDMAMFGLRLPPRPRAIITTTPKPVKVLKEIMANPGTVITRGTTYDNRSNLGGAFYDTVITKYEGTRLGRQELHAEVLDDNPNALWRRAWFDDYRLTRCPHLVRIAVGLDPPGTSSEGGAEAGLVVVGRDNQDPPHYYCLDDATIGGATPEQWGKQAVAAYTRWKADRVVAETNYGGEMVIATLRNVDASVAVEAVTATRGKVIRAEPVSALAEQGRWHMVGAFKNLEDECCEWQPGDPSPNRLDAMVWAATELMEPRTRFRVSRA